MITTGIRFKVFELTKDGTLVEPRYSDGFPIYGGLFGYEYKEDAWRDCCSSPGFVVLGITTTLNREE